MCLSETLALRASVRLIKPVSTELNEITSMTSRISLRLR
jgi:hypothetical protein